jgi:hypothetical protein
MIQIYLLRADFIMTSWVVSLPRHGTFSATGSQCMKVRLRFTAGRSGKSAPGAVSVRDHALCIIQPIYPKVRNQDALP